jgi:hypothetical protein
MLLKLRQVATNPSHLRARDMILLKFAFLCRDILGDSIRERFLALGLAVVRQREIDVERQRMGFASDPLKERLSLTHLGFRERRCDGL